MTALQQASFSKFLFFLSREASGFIILFTSIFTFFFFGEIRNLTTLCLLNNNGFSLSSFSLSSLSFLWIGAQFPQEKFLSYGRILTLDYYFLLMCILITGGKGISLDKHSPWQRSKIWFQHNRCSYFLLFTSFH